MLETEPQIVKAYVQTGRVKLMFRHLLDFGAPSLLASEAAECAGDQGKFWAMHELLYQRQDKTYAGSVAVFQQWATDDLKLDSAGFGACMNSHTHKAKIEQMAAAARSTDGVRVRPTYDINGSRLQGALRFPDFQKVIDAVR
ncbi:MAG: thioredoxin domain-containing protein [Chloroflexi bacterium]|nr:thioredoxin domain-containing protein [Chloroflexota bacterium]